MNFLKGKKMRFWKQRKEGEKSKNKMFVLRKRQVVAVSLMILIGIAGYLNWTFRNDAVDPDVAVMYQEVSKKIGEAKMVNGVSTSEQSEPSEAPTSYEPLQEDSLSKSGDNYFARARLEREVKRSESAEMLTQLIGAPGTDKETKSDAENKIQRMAEYTEQETSMENMIRAKGFSETVVFMNEDIVSVAVESNGFNEIDAAQIQDIVTSVCGCRAEQIKIVEIKPKE